MNITLNRANRYFDVYHIYENGHLLGIFEDHCRDVKERYFIGWKLDKPIGVNRTGKTKMFSTKEDAINYSIGKEETK